jgi:hypothetical protein
VGTSVGGGLVGSGLVGGTFVGMEVLVEAGNCVCTKVELDSLTRGVEV